MTQAPGITTHLLSLLTTIVDYSTGKFEEKNHFEESPSNSRFNHRGDEEDSEEKKNIEIPVIMEAAEEQKSALSEVLVAFVPQLAGLLSESFQVALSDRRAARRSSSQTGERRSYRGSAD